MKKLLFSAFVLFSTSAIQAQDIILKKNGEEIQSKIISISANEIKFKKHDNPQGPDIYLPKDEVFMITYENGVKEILTKPSDVKKAPEPKVHHPFAEENSPPRQETIKLSGPRIGITYISPGTTRDLLKETFDAAPVISQFGWQFETRFFTTEEGTSGMVEFIPLIGGLEQGLFLPSLSGLIAIREKSGYEFGIGPNISLSGAALVLAAGTSFRSGGVNFPVNFAVVPSKGGVRFSLVVGFNVVK